MLSLMISSLGKRGSDAPRRYGTGRAVIFLALLILAATSSCAHQDGAPPEATEANQNAAPAPSPSSKQEAGKSSALKKTGLTYEDRKAWREVLKWPDECEQAFDYPDKSYGGLEFYELADRKYLVEVVCTGGAYQGYQHYYFYDETKDQPTSELLTFDIYESQDEKSLTPTRSTEVWGLPTFDAKTKELRVLNKFRGPGDCGTLAVYGFEADKPVLKELRAKPNCDGRGAEHPEKWKKIVPGS